MPRASESLYCSAACSVIGMNTTAMYNGRAGCAADAGDERILQRPLVQSEQQVEEDQRDDPQNRHPEPLIEPELRRNEERNGPRLPTPETRQPETSPGGRRFADRRSISPSRRA